MKRKIVIKLSTFFLSFLLIITLSSCIFNTISLINDKNKKNKAYEILNSLDKSSYLSEFSHNNRYISCYIDKETSKCVYIVKYSDKINVFITYPVTLNNSYFTYKDYISWSLSYEYNFNDNFYTISGCNNSIGISTYKKVVFSETLEFNDKISESEFVSFVLEEEKLNLESLDLFDMIKYFLNNGEAFHLYDKIAENFNDDIFRLQIKPYYFFKNDNPYFSYFNLSIDQVKEKYIKYDNTDFSEEQNKYYIYIDLCISKDYKEVYTYLHSDSFLSISYFLPFCDEFNYTLVGPVVVL